MVLQVLTSGAVLTGFSLVAAQVVPLVFGDRWRPALEVFRFVAGAYLLMAGFALHNSLLYVLRRNRRVAAINALRVMTLTALSLVLLPLVGVAGYGLALLGAQASVVLLDREVRKVFQYRLARALPWLIVLLPPMFVPLIAMPAALLLWAPALALLSVPFPRDQLIPYGRTVRGALRSRAQPA